MKYQNGSAHVIFIGVVVLLVGALGFIFWQNFIHKEQVPANTDANENLAEQVDQNAGSKSKCKPGENENATNRVFCSDVYGVKFTIPSDFKNKLKLVANEKIYPVHYTDYRPEPIGESERILSAGLTKDKDKNSLTITLYPQINDMNLGLSGGAKFNEKTSKIVSTSSGEVFPEYQSVTSNQGVKIYRGSNYSELGFILYTNAVIIKDKIVKIELRRSSTQAPADSPADDEIIYSTLQLL